MDITGLFDKINEKNDIARATIRGRLSEMVRAGEVKKLASEKFKAIPVDEIVKIHAQEITQEIKQEPVKVEEPLVAN